MEDKKENVEQTQTKFTTDQENYLDWLALPKPLRSPITKTEYAEQMKVGRTTLYDWEKLEGFDDERKSRIKRWQKESTPQIVDALKNKALDGDVPAAKTWLEWVEGMEQNVNFKGNLKTELTFEKALEIVHDRTTAQKSNSGDGEPPVVCEERPQG